MKDSQEFLFNAVSHIYEDDHNEIFLFCQLVDHANHKEDEDDDDEEDHDNEEESEEQILLREYCQIVASIH